LPRPSGLVQAPLFAKCNRCNQPKRKTRQRGRPRRRSRELRKPMDGRRTLRERTPSGSPHKKITSGQLYGQPVPGTVEGQDGTWLNLYVWAVRQFGKRLRIADSEIEDSRVQMNRKDLAAGMLPGEQNPRRSCREARIRR